VKFARVFPVVSWTGSNINPQLYRRVFGTTEVVCGMLLAFTPGCILSVLNNYTVNRKKRGSLFLTITLANLN